MSTNITYADKLPKTASSEIKKIKEIILKEKVIKWGSKGKGDGQFNQPSGIAIDSKGNVYVVDLDNNRIQKLTSDGKFITKWGSSGTSDGQFNYPSGIAIDSKGNVYISDAGNNRIQKFTSDGKFITKWGSKDQFHTIDGASIDSKDNLYVVEYLYVEDIAYSRIQKFTSDGKFITAFIPDGTVNGLLLDPISIGFDLSGNVYVLEHTESLVQKFTNENFNKLGSKLKDIFPISETKKTTVEGRIIDKQVLDVLPTINGWHTSSTPKMDPRSMSYPAKGFVEGTQAYYYEGPKTQDLSKLGRSGTIFVIILKFDSVQNAVSYFSKLHVTFPDFEEEAHGCKYMWNMPVDPKSGTPYRYEVICYKHNFVFGVGQHTVNDGDYYLEMAKNIDSKIN